MEAMASPRPIASSIFSIRQIVRTKLAQQEPIGSASAFTLRQRQPTIQVEVGSRKRRTQPGMNILDSSNLRDCLGIAPCIPGLAR